MIAEMDGGILQRVASYSLASPEVKKLSFVCVSRRLNRGRDKQSGCMKHSKLSVLRRIAWRDVSVY